MKRVHEGGGARGRGGPLPLFERAHALRREALGERHPDTLISLNNLAFIYETVGRRGEALGLQQQAVAQTREVLTARHPDTLQLHLSLIIFLVRDGRTEDAVRELRRMEDGLLGWLTGELRSTQQGGMRRALLNAQARFQDARSRWRTTVPGRAL